MSQGTLNSLFISAAAPQHQLVRAHFDKTLIDVQHVESALECGITVAEATPVAMLPCWRSMLTVVLVLRANQNLSPFLPLITKRLRHLKTLSVWPEDQLLATYHFLIEALLGLSSGKLIIAQLSNGACPSAPEGYWPWGEVPHPLFHAELGALLCLYAKVSGDARYSDYAVKIAEWQRNTLDYSLNVFCGLLSREGECTELALLINNWLLFDAVAKSAGRSDMAGIAASLWSTLIEALKDGGELPPYAAILSEAFGEPIVAASVAMDTHFADPDLAIVGVRTKQVSAISTLYGGCSGMGCLQAGDLKIISYGPQHLPLSDCQGFGIEGGRRLLAEHVKGITADDDGYRLEGVSRMASGATGGRGIWIDSRQSFRGGELCIETTFQELEESIEDSEALAFSFFVKCKTCEISGGKTIKTGSPNRYFGPAASVCLQGTDAALILAAGQKHAEMHVIPLGGGAHFWGADFLVAYLLSPGQKCYSWSTVLKII